MSDLSAHPRALARTRTLSCPNCGGSIDVRAAGISVSAVCGSCGATIDVANESLAVIAEARKLTRQPLIPIGERGELLGTGWQVIGYQVRRIRKTGWTWEEYLLFSPFQGFRFLAHDEDGWTLAALLRRDLDESGRGPGWKVSYAKGETVEVETEYVLGEFYWRARAGDTVWMTEYTNPPSTVILERNGEELLWSESMKITVEQLRTAFRVQPTPEELKAVTTRQKTMRTLRIAAIALGVLLLAHAIPFGSHHDETVFSQSFKTTIEDKTRPITTPPFTIPDSSGNVRIDVASNLANNWLDLNVALVREPDGLSFNAVQGLEYYSGYSDGESWSEGSQSASINFASVPGGSYRLVIEPDAGAYAAARVEEPNGLAVSMARMQNRNPPLPTYIPAVQVPFTVKVIRHAAAWEFFFLALLVLLPYPAYRLIFRRGKKL